eukprot:scaffold272322_cov16-Prasinocladus_malaysianus.AAC.1
MGLLALTAIPAPNCAALCMAILRVPQLASHQRTAYIPSAMNKICEAHHIERPDGHFVFASGLTPMVCLQYEFASSLPCAQAHT